MADPKKREKFCEDIWIDMEFSGLAESMAKPSYDPSESHQYIEPEDPKDGYHVRGVGPVTWKVTNPECDHY